MEKVKDILFITPTLNRTGSEIVLFNLLKGLDSKYNAKILTVEKGVLYNELDPKIERDYLIVRKPGNLAEKIKTKIIYNVFLPVKLYFNRKRIWYVNTIVLPVFLRYAKKYGARVVVHTHELAHMWNVLDSENKTDLVSVPSLVIANSKYSEEVFLKHGYKGPIELCNPSIDTDKYIFDRNTYLSVRKKLSIPENGFVWLMCGTIDENKNPELFIELAAKFKDAFPSTRFIWVGDNTNDPAYKQYCLDKSKNLDNLIWVHEGGSAYLDYMQSCDGFVLTSKFESFSLVTLEALALGKPVVANDCLGVSEIINSQETGIIIKKKNDLGEFYAEMTDVMNNPSRFNSNKAVQRSKEFDHKIARKRWNDILARYI